MLKHIEVVGLVSQRISFPQATESPLKPHERSNPRVARGGHGRGLDRSASCEMKAVPFWKNGVSTQRAGRNNDHSTTEERYVF